MCAALHELYNASHASEENRYNFNKNSVEILMKNVNSTGQLRYKNLYKKLSIDIDYTTAHLFGDDLNIFNVSGDQLQYLNTSEYYCFN